MEQTPHMYLNFPQEKASFILQVSFFFLSSSIVGCCNFPQFHKGKIGKKKPETPFKTALAQQNNHDKFNQRKICFEFTRNFSFSLSFSIGILRGKTKEIKERKSLNMNVKEQNMKRKKIGTELNVSRKFDEKQPGVSIFYSIITEIELKQFKDCSIARMQELYDDIN